MSEPLTITRVTPSCHLIQVADATVLTGPWFSGRVLYHPGEPVAAGAGLPAPFGGGALLIPWLRTLPGRSGRFDVALLPVSGRRILPQLNRQIVMDAEQAAELAVLRPQAAVPHHHPRRRLTKPCSRPLRLRRQPPAGTSASSRSASCCSPGPELKGVHHETSSSAPRLVAGGCGSNDRPWRAVRGGARRGRKRGRGSGPCPSGGAGAGLAALHRRGPDRL